MFKVNNRNTRSSFEMCSSVSIVNFEKVNADWLSLIQCGNRDFSNILHLPKQAKFFNLAIQSFTLLDIIPLTVIKKNAY